MVSLRRALLVAWLSTGLATLAPSAARADSAADKHSPYEQASIKSALAALHAEIDEDPEGKIVERVEVVPLDVIEPRDPLPGFLNWFHFTTLRYVIRREILVRAGDRYSTDRVDETARNLRAIPQFSLVLAVPIKGRDAQHVRVLVITKDVWSLRLNSSYRFNEGTLQYLLLQPSEENLWGTHHSAAVQLVYDPESLAVGARYTIPRVAGSHVRLSTSANIILSCAVARSCSGKPEGSFGNFKYGQPLYSTEARWAWEAEVIWRNDILRRYVDIEAGGSKTRAFRALFSRDELTGTYAVTRSFGSEIKHDITLAARADRDAYRADDFPVDTPIAPRDDRLQALPKSDTSIGPVVQYRTYSTKFFRVLDFETLGLQEDFRFGHDLTLRIYPVTTALNSTRNYLGVLASGTYSVRLGDGLVRLFAESITEAEVDRLADASIEVGGRMVSPRTGIGRLVLDSRFLHRYRNYLNHTSLLGGDTRPRGYPTQAFIGKDTVAASLEFRSRPVQVFTLQLAGVAFFDTGDAFDGLSDMKLKPSAGFGARLLIPLFDRTVMRADWGFPLARGWMTPGTFPGDIVVTLGQAFTVPAATK